PAVAPSLYSLSLHDALPISFGRRLINFCSIVAHWLIYAAYPAVIVINHGCCYYRRGHCTKQWCSAMDSGSSPDGLLHWHGTRLCRSGDRKSTRLNSSHVSISYAVFCFLYPISLLSFPTRRSSDLSTSALLLLIGSFMLHIPLSSSLTTVAAITGAGTAQNSGAVRWIQVVRLMAYFIGTVLVCAAA